jgi:Na+/H+ antiporter NhaC
MNIITIFLPVLLFVSLYVGSGIYFSLAGVNNAFYQLSPIVAIIPAIALGWVMHRGTTEERMHSFLDGVRHRDIITMVIIFLLAGAFSTVTKSIGSVDATVNFALSTIPPHLLLIGLFLTAAFISTAIGTSMATIATVAPIAAGLIDQGAFPAAIGMATVVGGAMFGDNLSVISDTTIASVMSQEANLRAKLKLNAIVAAIASIITMALLFFMHETNIAIAPREFSWFLITPYLFILILAILGVNIFVLLVMGLVFSGVLGFVSNGYSVLALGSDIVKGFVSMNEIMLLSLMVGGLSGLAGKGYKALAEQLGEWISRRGGGKRMAQLMIAKLSSIFDILLANNTIAIIVSGEMARNIAKKFHIPPHYSAAWLQIFSCVFQGIIPHGAQILLASTIAGISPLSVIPYVYYCYVLGIVSVLYILLNKRLR